MAHEDEGATQESSVLIPREQRHVLIEGEDVLAVWIGERDIYIPLRPMCDALGIVARAQITRIRRDDVLAERLRSLRLDTPGGPQTVQALHLSRSVVKVGRIRYAGSYVPNNLNGRATPRTAGAHP